MFPQYNNQNYMKDLQLMRDRIDRQLQMNYQAPQPPLVQNFQMTSQTNGIKYVNSVDDVKNELVFNDTLFVNKEYTLLWVKNVSGEVKSYKLEELVELDEKDLKIKELELQINDLKEIMNNGYTKCSETNDDVIKSDATDDVSSKSKSKKFGK